MFFKIFNAITIPIVRMTKELNRIPTQIESDIPKCVELIIIIVRNYA